MIARVASLIVSTRAPFYGEAVGASSCANMQVAMSTSRIVFGSSCRRVPFVLLGIVLSAGCAAPWFHRQPTETPAAAADSADASLDPDATTEDEAATDTAEDASPVSDILDDYEADLAKLPPDARQRIWEAVRVLSQVRHVDTTRQADTARKEKSRSADSVSNPSRDFGRSSLDTRTTPSRRSNPRRKKTFSAKRRPSEPTAPRAPSRGATESSGEEASDSLSGSRAPALASTDSRRANDADHARETAPASTSEAERESSGAEADLDWHTSLQRSIAALRRELDDEETAKQLSDAELARREVILRMLQVAAGDEENALQEFRYVQGREAAFWRAELFALHLATEANRTPVVSQRAARMLEHLRKANSELAAVSTLDLRNAAFCKNVFGYADVEKFRPYRFEPDQEVLLYVEIENFAFERISAPTERGVGEGERFETEFRGTYHILDGERRRVAQQELPRAKQVSRNLLRDYFVAYRIYMPRNIAPGRYTLELTLEDVKGDKFGQTFLDFEIAR